MELNVTCKAPGWSNLCVSGSLFVCLMHMQEEVCARSILAVMHQRNVEKYDETTAACKLVNKEGTIWDFK